MILYNYEPMFGNKDLKIHDIYNCCLLSGCLKNLMIHNIIFIFFIGSYAHRLSGQSVTPGHW